MANISQHKKHGLIDYMLKPKCVRAMEDSICELTQKAEQTVKLVKQNGYALERAKER